MRKILLKAGSFVMSGGGSAWPYALTQPQGGPVDVRLAIGPDHRLCADRLALPRVAASLAASSAGA